MKRKKLILGAALAALFLIAAVIGVILFSPQQNAAIELLPTATTIPTASQTQLAGATDIPAPSPSAEKPDSNETDGPTSKPTASPTRTASPSLFCTLTIKGSNIEVYDSVEESSLKKHPGWLSSSALPGQDGMCVIYGHRNRRHLRVLEKIQNGDTITVAMVNGAQYIYTVSDTKIFESTDELKLPVLEGRSLVLVTCYPFHYSGNAPGKFVATASIP